jgi:hypothetical protein
VSDAVQVAIIVGFFGVITATISLFGVYIARQTHTLINSRMDEMLKLTRSESRAEGVAAGEQAQRDRANSEPQP